MTQSFVRYCKFLMLVASAQVFCVTLSWAMVLPSCGDTETAGTDNTCFCPQNQKAEDFLLSVPVTGTGAAASVESANGCIVKAETAKNNCQTADSECRKDQKNKKKTAAE